MTQKSTWISFIFAAYLGLVCLVSGIVTAVSAGSIVNNAIVYQFPQLEVSWHSVERAEFDQETKEKVKPSTTEKAERLTQQKQRVQLRSLRDIVDAATYLIIALLIFFFHWRLFKKERAA